MSFVLTVCQCVADLFLKSDPKKQEENQDSPVGTTVQQPTPTIVQQPSNNVSHQPPLTTIQHQPVAEIPLKNLVTFKSGEDIPSSYFENKTIIYGEPTQILDGDTFKFYHKASPNATTPKAIHVLKNETIKIRIAGIDAPEVAHNGNPEQPFGQESMKLLSSLILHKQVSLQLLSRDQYGRVVARVMVNNIDVGVEILKKGMADLYTGRGADYGGKKMEMEAALRAGKAAKVGIWSQSGRIESPAEYKRRTKA